ncbi:unnamed protein product [Protopolystoma xenopodis]|uniref:Uncharacterized protein n=1 Tax=Protopolystoma xenopodis TaxID=117903 RepID=A0A3S5CRD6_9PLAT|nr:unnamed protein product [Protopolystoma xenopodis]
MRSYFSLPKSLEPSPMAPGTQCRENSSAPRNRTSLFPRRPWGGSNAPSFEMNNRKRENVGFMKRAPIADPQRVQIRSKHDQWRESLNKFTPLKIRLIREYTFSGLGQKDHTAWPGFVGQTIFECVTTTHVWTRVRVQAAASL